MELERRGLLDAVITQNIDGLHEAAGTRDLIEVHGSISHSSCLECLRRYELEETRERLADDPVGVPRCDCGHALKPDVVLFGEFLPMEAMGRAEELSEHADLLLCVGSSLEVYPVAGLPSVCLRAGGQARDRHPGPDEVRRGRRGAALGRRGRRARSGRRGALGIAAGVVAADEERHDDDGEADGQDHHCPGRY